ncbi:hypothetical protein JHW43_000689 [Diplocarpon mali]|nr:hypothetical protein JHW43_000689 [Diplocarpon mali]
MVETSASVQGRAAAEDDRRNRGRGSENVAYMAGLLSLHGGQLGKTLMVGERVLVGAARIRKLALCWGPGKAARLGMERSVMS